VKKPLGILFGFVLVFCVGCQTIQVKRAATSTAPSVTDQTGAVKSVPGIPFYVKKAACLHSVVWLEPVYSLTLEIIGSAPGTTAKPNSSQVGSTTLSLSQIQGPQAIALFRALNKDEPEISDVMAAWVKLTAQDKVPYNATAFPPVGDRILISNTSEPQVYVDYSQPYYLNAKRPLAGTVKLDNKLASDGTLTEVSVEVEDKTIEAIGTAISDITTAVGSAIKSTAPAPMKQMRLSISTGGFKHTKSKFEPSMGLPCSAGADDIAGQSSYSRVDIASTEKKSDAKTDAKGSKITLSGEIVLPEAKPSVPDTSKAAPAATAPTPAASAAPKKVKK
jgi:hypothetical protein